jgi:hypothetical protein
MKSVLIKRTDDWSYAAQRRRSSGNISTKREGLDEIGSRRRTDLAFPAKDFRVRSHLDEPYGNGATKSLRVTRPV